MKTRESREPEKHETTAKGPENHVCNGKTTKKTHESCRGPWEPENYENRLEPTRPTRLVSKYVGSAAMTSWWGSYIEVKPKIRT